MQSISTLTFLLFVATGSCSVDSSFYVNLTLNAENIENLGFLSLSSSEVTFVLVTRDTGGASGLPIQTGHLAQYQHDARINTGKAFKFITHGYLSSRAEAWYASLTDAYLQKDDYNVVHVDWSRAALSAYPVAARYTRDVGLHLAKLIVDVCQTWSVPFSNIHLLGHSLGAHISGYAGSYVSQLSNAKVGRISGLDPAGPLFLLASTNNRLDPTDAQYVDVIHVDGGKYGYYPHCGHADYYPNGGVAPQPKCGIDELLGCSHVTAPFYYAESISSQGFMARACGSYWEYRLGLCQTHASSLMGEYSTPAADVSRNSFYLTTNAQPPFARFGAI